MKPVGGITAGAEAEAEAETQVYAGVSAVGVRPTLVLFLVTFLQKVPTESTTLTQLAAAPQRWERVWRSNQYFGSKGGVGVRNPDSGPNRRESK